MPTVWDCGRMRREDDEALFASLIEGDEAALRPLMERYGDALTLYINGYVHDLVEAEDLMIEAYSRMLAKRPRLRGGGFKPYLYKTARNLALWHVRARSRFMSVDDLDAQQDNSERVEDALLRDERDRALYRCLAQTPVECREALYLVYLEGMSYEKAGAIMRKTRKQVDHLVERGKREMRSLLEGEGVSYEID